MTILDYFGGKEFIDKNYPTAGCNAPHHMSMFLSEKNECGQFTEQCFNNVYRHDPAWVDAQKKRFLSKEVSTSLGALGELRAYADLLSLCLKIKANGTRKGTDFSVFNHKDEELKVEVITLNYSPNSKIDHGTTVNGSITRNVSEYAPFGFPEFGKEGDSIAANAVSRLRGKKAGSYQASRDIPTVLYVDFQTFPMNSSSIEDCDSIVSWQGAISSGNYWLAFYGEKGLPIMDNLRLCDHPSYYMKPMQHEGRFYRNNDDNYCAAILSFTSWRDGLILFENPRNMILPDWAKTHMTTWSRMNFELSCWQYDDFPLAQYIEMKNKRILSAYKLFTDTDKY
jgi:hypothetical protein